MIEPIKWHATEDGLCHVECEAWKDNGGNCPWMVIHGAERAVGSDFDYATPGEPCGVYALLLMIGRAPSAAATSKPACATCPYFESVGETCHAEPPKVVPLGEDADAFVETYFPEVGSGDWCAKHPKIEALRMRAMTTPLQSMMGEVAAMIDRSKENY